MLIKFLSFYLSFFLLFFNSWSIDQSILAKPQKKEVLQLATFAGGCFWCVEATLEKIKGVKLAISGYSGGSDPKPTYESVTAKKGGHVEAVQVYYNPRLVKYKTILEHFLRIIDPTDNKGQFADRGYSYKPFIFYHNAKQKRTAQRALKKLSQSKRFQNPIRVPIVAYKNFYKAEDYHQDYYLKNPSHYKRYFYGSGRAAFIQRVWGKKYLSQ